MESIDLVETDLFEHTPHPQYFALHGLHIAAYNQGVSLELHTSAVAQGVLLNNHFSAEVIFKKPGL